MKKKDSIKRKLFFVFTVWMLWMGMTLNAWGDVLFTHHTRLTSETTWLNEDDSPRETWRYVYEDGELISEELVWSEEWGVPYPGSV